MFAQVLKTGLRERQRSLLVLIAFLIFGVKCLPAVHAQDGRGRQPIKKTFPAPSAKLKTHGVKRRVSSTKRYPVPVKLATLAVNLPAGSRVWLNQIEVEVQNSDHPISFGKQKITTSYSLDQDLLIISGLNPGACELNVRKADYREFMQTIELIADRNNTIAVQLTPIPGSLTVKPTVSGASIEVFDLSTSISLGRYGGQLERFEIAPGNYRVSSSKVGYLTATRDITIRPAESVYLEPVVELLPKPKPAPNTELRGGVLPTALFVQKSGKEELFRIQGSSGNASATVGTISVRHGGPSLTHEIAGAFSGLPCQIDFVRLENVAEGAVFEAPGPSNQWRVIVVRLRRKDEKRAVSFAINWRSLPSDGVQGKERNGHVPPDTFTPATALVKIKPHFPEAARQSLNGIVNVLIFINEYGNVISAKALNGPLMFRPVSEEAARNWKFSPSLRSGRPVESQQTLQFNFQN